MRTFTSLEEVAAAVGESLGTSEWDLIDQARIDAFISATGDDHWLHLVGAKSSDGPYGQPIAHGFLTLAMLTRMMWQISEVDGVETQLNYGVDRVRFPAVVPVDSRIRAHAELVSVEQTAVGTRLTVRATVEREGGEKPVCVADLVTVLSA